MSEEFALTLAGPDPLEARGRIASLEAEMLKQPQIAMEVTHHFAPGVYARELRIPAGVLLTGKLHKTEHLNVISAGEISVLTESGSRRIRAPYTFVSKPGAKRVGYAHEDTVWTTFHVTEETDLAKIEESVIAKDFTEIEGKTLDQLKGEV